MSAQEPTERTIQCPGCLRHAAQLRSRLERYRLPENEGVGFVFAGGETQRLAAIAELEAAIEKLPAPAVIEQRKIALSHVWFPPHCDPCNARIERTNAERAERETKEKLARRFAASGLPPVYATGRRGAGSLAEGPDTDGFRAARHVLAQLITGGADAPWVHVWSRNTGTFKTTIACVALQQSILNGESGRYFYWPSFLKRWQAAHGDENDVSPSALEQQLIESPRVVLDEIGTQEAMKGAGPGLLTRVLNQRLHLDLDARTPRWLVMTANVPIATIVRLCADATGDPRLAAQLERRASEFTIEIDVMS